MGKKKSKRIEIGVPGSPAEIKSSSGPGGPGLTHSPFASLRGTLGEVPEAPGDRSQESGASAAPIDTKPSSLGGTVVVRHERKGHGGKTVTVADLSRAGGSAAQDLDQVAKALRKALGAGARAGDQCVTVQGDQVERVAAFFGDSYGVNVTLGTR